MSFWPHPTGLVQAQFVRGFSNHHFVHIHICSCWPPATPYCKQDKVCSPYPNIENLQPFTSESFSSMNFCCDPTWTFYCCKTGLPLFSQDIPFSFFSQWPLPRVCLLHLPQTTSPFFPLFKASLVFKIQLKSYLLRVEVEELYYFPFGCGFFLDMYHPQPHSRSWQLLHCGDRYYYIHGMYVQLSWAFLSSPTISQQMPFKYWMGSSHRGAAETNLTRNQEVAGLITGLAVAMA